MRASDFMALAIERARAAGRAGEVPVGAVVVDAHGRLLAEAGNTVCGAHDPSGHAEINAIRAACRRVGNERLIGCEMYVTLEPCAMCAGAIAHARVHRLYYGAYDTREGTAAGLSTAFGRTHRPSAAETYGGFRESECSALLKEFFTARRYRPGRLPDEREPAPPGMEPNGRPTTQRR